MGESKYYYNKVGKNQYHACIAAVYSEDQFFMALIDLAIELTH